MSNINKINAYNSDFSNAKNTDDSNCGNDISEICNNKQPYFNIGRGTFI